MGNFLNMIIFMLCISFISLLVVVGQQGIDPTGTNHLLGDYLFGRFDPLGSSLVGTQSSNNWTYNGNNTDLPSQNDATLSTPTTIFPDWINSVLKWVTAPLRFTANLASAPYALMSNMGLDPRINAIIGGFYGTLFILLIVLFILGRAD